jgi:hypothetical protein
LNLSGGNAGSNPALRKKPYLVEIIVCLLDFDVAFIICGGMAVVFHGVERMTMDVDISLDMDPGNVKKFLSAVKHLGLIPRVPVPPESLLDEKMVDFFIREKKAIVFTFIDPDYPYRQIDVFLTKDKSYKSLIKHSVKAMVEEKVVDIISIEKLIKMKEEIKPPRDKDVMDIAALKKISGSKENWDE